MDPSAKPNFDFSSAPAGQGIGSAPSAPAFSGGAPETSANFSDAHGMPDGQTIPVDARDHGGYKGVHPVAALFHVIFKIAAILVYLLGAAFMSYTVVLVVTMLLLAADFWTTKNITGRILVSMRWRNEVKDDGTTEWLFESSPEADQRVNAYDNWFFWVTLLGNLLAWIVLLLLNLFSFKYLPIKLAAVVLAGVNVYGYLKCRRDARQRLTNFMMTQAVNRPQTAGRVASFFMGGADNTPSAAPAAAPRNTA